VRTERISFFNRNVFSGILVISLVFLTVALVPFIGSVVIVLTPLPVIFFVGKLGRLKGVVVLAVSLLIVETILQQATAGGDVFLFLLLGYLGIVIHEMLRKGLSVEKTVLFTVIAGVTLAIVLLLIQSALLRQMPWTLVAAYITKSFQESLDLSTQMGAQANQIKFIKDNIDIITRSLLYIFPAITLVGISFVTWLNIIVVRKLYLMNSLAYPDFGELTRWKAPEGTVWFLIAAGASILLPPVLEFKIPGGTVTGLNILIVCLFIYFLQGLAIFEFYFKTRQVPRLLRIMFYFFLILQQYLIILVIAAGLFDLWLDFRRLTPKPEAPEA
jgi:uncharacterized protein YybS (DUF2232 family)